MSWVIFTVVSLICFFPRIGLIHSFIDNAKPLIAISLFGSEPLSISLKLWSYLQAFFWVFVIWAVVSAIAIMLEILLRRAYPDLSNHPEKRRSNDQVIRMIGGIYSVFEWVERRVMYPLRPWLSRGLVVWLTTGLMTFIIVRTGIVFALDLIGVKELTLAVVGSALVKALPQFDEYMLIGLAILIIIALRVLDTEILIRYRLALRHEQHAYKVKQKDIFVGTAV